MKVFDFVANFAPFEGMEAYRQILAPLSPPADADAVADAGISIQYVLDADYSIEQITAKLRACEKILRKTPTVYGVTMNGNAIFDLAMAALSLSDAVDDCRSLGAKDVDPEDILDKRPVETP